MIRGKSAKTGKKPSSKTTSARNTLRKRGGTARVSARASIRKPSTEKDAILAAINSILRRLGLDDVPRGRTVLDGIRAIEDAIPITAGVLGVGLHPTVMTLVRTLATIGAPQVAQTVWITLQALQDVRSRSHDARLLGAIELFESVYYIAGLAPGAPIAFTPLAATRPPGFTVVLCAGGSNKIAAIKMIREITGLGLKDAKDLVDGAPRDVKWARTQYEADSIARRLLAVGAAVVIEKGAGTDDNNSEGVESAPQLTDSSQSVTNDGAESSGSDDDDVHDDNEEPEEPTEAPIAGDVHDDDDDDPYKGSFREAADNEGARIARDTTDE